MAAVEGVRVARVASAALRRIFKYIYYANTIPTLFLTPPQKHAVSLLAQASGVHLRGCLRCRQVQLIGQCGSSGA